MARLEATAGAAKKAAQQRASRALQEKAKAEKSAELAVSARDKIGDRLAEVQNYAALVTKWRMQAAKELKESG